MALVLERGGKRLEATVERDEAEHRVWKVAFPPPSHMRTGFIYSVKSPGFI